MTDAEFLKDSALKLGVELDNEQIYSFLYYLDELKLWNRKLNLTSVENDHDIIIKHFIDSLTPCSYLFNNCCILDIGTGAGFPGIPIAIVNNSYNLTLLESREKRTHFLNHIVRKLALSNVHVVRGRAEDEQNGIKRACFDFVICRAFAKIVEILEVSKGYLNRKGKIILMRGAKGEQELETLRQESMDAGIKIDDINRIVLPNSDYRRLNVLISFS